MAEPPGWGFHDLSVTTRWILAEGLETTIPSPRRPLDDDEWTAVRHQCSSHRLDGHLVAVVADGSLPVTEEQRAEAAAIEQNLTDRRIRYDEVCRPVFDALEHQGITYRRIKGSALPWSDYPDPQLRPTADLDLLVPGDQIAAAVRLLEDLGGSVMNPEPSAHYARLVFKGLTVKLPTGLEVDLHRILSWGPFGVRVPEADLWSPGRSFDHLGRSATTLDVDRTLIHVSAHLLLLGATRASELRDVAQLACSTDLDPTRVRRIARHWGQEAIVATALRMIERELELRAGCHPLSEWAASYRVCVRDRMWLRVDRPDDPVKGIEPLAVFVELSGLRPRVELAKAIVAPRKGTDPGLWERVAKFVPSRHHR